MAITITQLPCEFFRTRRFRIRIHDYSTLYVFVTTNPLVVCIWLYHILCCPRLTFGLGVQFNVRGGHHPASTIQICVDRRVLIFQLRHAPFSPYILRWLLANPCSNFVSLGTFGTRKLFRSPQRLQMVYGMPIDLDKLLTEQFRINTRGMFVPDIVRTVLGIDMEWVWNVEWSDWDVEELGLDQIKHAAVYAFVCHEIGVMIGAWRFNTRLLG